MRENGTWRRPPDRRWRLRGARGGAPFGAAAWRRGMLVVLAVAACGLSGGCGTMRGGGIWGGDATLAPGFHRLGRAAASAARDPATWVPLLAAGAFGAGDFDQRTSDWAAKKTPLFGSNAAAEQASDRLRNGLTDLVYVTALVTPSGPDPGPWAAAKGKGLLAEFAAMRGTGLVTNEVKGAAQRVRPDESDDSSFPSGHTSRAGSAARLTERNLRALDLAAPLKVGTDVLLATSAALTGWARVEARVHYPSDVLAGAAIGNFLSAFVHDGFMGLPLDEVGVEVGRHGSDAALVLRFRY